MNINKKRIAILALILTLVATNVAVAVMYMNRDVTISGGVSTEGSIQVFDQTGETVMATYDFPDFNSTTGTTYTRQFFVNNTGNVPVVVYWDLLNPIPTGWSIAEGANYYVFTEGGNMKYQFTIYRQVVPDASTGYWRPTVATGNGISLGVGQGGRFSIDLFHNATMNAPGDFSFVLSFRAFDA